MYENLAAKYRPMTLSDLIGQEAVKTTLKNAVKLNRVAHSYVFYGPRGCGKTTVARILAKTLNCHAPDKNGEPCGKCPSCLEITESNSLDVIEIDAASNTAVDNVRSVIVEQVNFAPSRDKYKIYILDEVHMLSKGSFNALLKTLEEPPSHVVFIMATTEQEKVPATILSRSQCFRFKFIPEHDIAERLKHVAELEKIAIDSESLSLIAKSCGGAMRDALTLLDRAASFCGNEISIGILNELLGRPDEELLQLLMLSLVNRDSAALHSSFDRIMSEGYDALTVLRELRNALSDAFFAMLKGEKTGPAKWLPASVSAWNIAKLSRKLTVLIKETQYSDTPAISAEVGLFTLIDIPQDLNALVKRLEDLEKQLDFSRQENDELILYQSSPLKKKDEPNLEEAHGTVASQPAAASYKPFNSASFAEAWRKTLGRISAERPTLYNALAECGMRHDDKGTVTLVATNPFYANRVSYALETLSELMSGFLGRKIDFIVTSGAAALKSSEKISMPLNPENIAPAASQPVLGSAKKNEPQADNAFSDGDPVPETGEEAEITETEDSPSSAVNEKSAANEAVFKPAAAVAKPAGNMLGQKQNSYGKGSVRTEGKAMPAAQNSKGSNLQSAHLTKENGDKPRGNPARHKAASLEYVPPEEMPAEFSSLKEIFGAAITRINKVL